MQTPITSTNVELDLAFDYVVNTDRSVFLTGKAGTGKTTFLKRLKEHTPKRITIVAPTGVAAINAGGVTIHSLFQLPFSPFLPGSTDIYMKRFSKEKINLIKSIDLLVIDEISMVRCDVLDAIDSVLRRHRDRYKPFGGVQLLLIGDINQLAPVAKENEWELIREHYESVFFFSSKALQENFPVIIELRQIFRQTDRAFIQLLNKVRNHAMDDETFGILNQRINPEIYGSPEEEGYITLSTHNYIAREINQDKLEQLPGKSWLFKAEVIGDFPEYSFPTDESLELKIGAQVMFIKNETGREKRYFNGKIGIITKIEEEKISIRTDEHDRIDVGVETWQNIKYSLNAETKAIEENIIGEFKQIPLKLAYAITIHKSQGLTFDKVIIDAKAAFSSGQVYVALSRCRTLEGIILSTPITLQSLKPDYDIKRFNSRIAKEEPDQQKLQQAKKEYQESLIMELLDFNTLQKPLFSLQKLIKENTPPLNQELRNMFVPLVFEAQESIGKVMIGFQRQVRDLLTGEEFAEDNSAFKERLNKAAVYFEEKINTLLIEPLDKMVFLTDNKSIKEALQKTLNVAKKAAAVKMACFRYCKREFKSLEFVHTRVNAEIDFESADKQDYGNGRISIPSNISHPELYKQIKEFRRNTARENGTEEYMIFSQKALLGIVSEMPTNFLALESISGIGKISSRRFGTEILNIVKTYCAANNVTQSVKDEFPFAEPPKRQRGSTFKLSFEMFNKNLSASEIAKERGLAEGTIHSHLSKFVESGELPVEKVLSKEKLDVLTILYTDNPELKSSEAITGLGPEYSYNDIRYFLSYWKNGGVKEVG